MSDGHASSNREAKDGSAEWLLGHAACFIRECGVTQHADAGMIRLYNHLEKLVAHAIPKRVYGEEAVEKLRDSDLIDSLKNVDATRNRVPTEKELAEVMAACWDHDGFTSNRAANGYPKMAKALRKFLLERMA